MTKIGIDITYENQNVFQIKAKTNDEETRTIIRVEENGCIGCIWSEIQKTYMAYFKTILDAAGVEMKKEA